jgi:hypothetical protein
VRLRALPARGQRVAFPASALRRPSVSVPGRACYFGERVALLCQRVALFGQRVAFPDRRFGSRLSGLQRARPLCVNRSQALVDRGVHALDRLLGRFEQQY